jgi:hypothetical protein
MVQERLYRVLGLSQRDQRDPLLFPQIFPPLLLLRTLEDWPCRVEGVGIAECTEENDGIESPPPAGYAYLSLPSDVAWTMG